MSNSPIKFGTSGWRGLIADDFTFANVRRVAQGTAQYLLSRGEDPVAVVVERERAAVMEHDVFEQQEVAVRVFLLAEQRVGRSARRVIDRADEGEGGAAPLEPIVATAIDLEQHAFLGHAFPTAAVLGCPAFPWAGYPRFPEDAANG